MVKGRKRHLFVWKFATALVKPWLTKKFNYTPVPADVEGPFLLLANHSTDFDPFLVGLSFSQQMYFVASEHIFRWGAVSWLLRLLFDPISRLKGQSAANTVMTVLRRIKQGCNVGIFAAGERTWDGSDCPVSPATAKLARSCGATLVTYRIEGGYFSSPRWSRSVRKGKMRGSVVGVYSKEELKAMSLEEINELIRRDLSEDAGERQKKEQTRFEGKSLAESLETLLCVCPECGRLGTMHSAGDELFCADCGFKTRYTSLGEFGSGKFKTVREWNLWQTEQIEALAARSGSGALFSDEKIILRHLREGHKAEKRGAVRLEMFRDRIECGDITWKTEDISGLALHGKNGMNITAGECNYELVSKNSACLYKYLIAYKALRREKDGLLSR